MRFHKPQINLKRSDWKKFKQICQSGWVCNGQYVHQLEEKLKTETGVKYAIACSSATQGMIITLRAIGIRNKKIAIPAFTWPSTEYAIRCSGNEPVFQDIDKETWLMSFQGENALPVDTFGNEYQPDNQEPLVIDAAHSYGLPNLGKRAKAEVVSLSFTKPITAMQGGIILTDDDNLYAEMSELRDLSSKMCEINAMIALNATEEPRKQAIEIYRQNIKIDYQEQKITNSNHSVYAIVLPHKNIRDRIVNEFTRNDVEVKIYYEPLKTGLPNTDWLYERILALPIYKEMIPQIPKICQLINRG